MVWCVVWCGCVVWCLALGIYMMRFMTLGLKINKKYRNLSVLITEQVGGVLWVCGVVCMVGV